MERIKDFITNNNYIKANNDEDKLIIYNCWNDFSFYLEYSNEDNLDFLKNILLPCDLFAIFHKDNNLYEFIFLPVTEKYELDIQYIFCGNSYRLYYDRPTESFEKIATHAKLADNADINERSYGLLRYSRYYRHRPDNEQEQIIPTNFFIEGDFSNIPYEKHIELFRHVNFMLSYYDRNSPFILLFNNDEYSICDIKIPCKSNSEGFPSIINSNAYNSTLLELMEAAKNTNSYRLKYIFYFQVLEYCSYYYIENNLKRQITNIIKSPDIINSNKYSNRIIEIFSDYFKSNKDEKRMERLLSDLCSFEDIKDEIKTNSRFFIEDINFDGGFSVKGMFKDESEIDNASQIIIPTIRKNIESIRNVLVHARESRENSEIKPTQKNIELLKPYLYLLRRIAETVIIKYE